MNIINNKREIAILLSTYNGAKYISQQLDSLIAQTYTHWTLYIRDDGSSDQTISIIIEYCQKDSRIVLYEDDLGNVGTKYSFMTLLEHIQSEYYMFSDQDDVWLKNKISISYSSLLATELQYEKSLPLLFVSDVSIVDSNLQMIDESYWRIAHISPKLLFNYNAQMVSPSLIGMTMFFNQAAKLLCFPPHLAAGMHDSWLGANVAKYGKIIAAQTPLVLYRQHANNVYGVDKKEKRTFLYAVVHFRDVIKKNNDRLIIAKRLGFGSTSKYIVVKCSVWLKKMIFFYFVK